MIAPHGGKLVNQVASIEEGRDFKKRANSLRKLEIGLREVCDVELIAFGAYSPLTGFLKREDYESVLERMQLKNGVVWTLPVVLPASSEVAHSISEGESIALVFQGREFAFMEVEEKYTYDKEKEAEMVYRTKDLSHPGVLSLYSQGDFYLGGKITLIFPLLHTAFSNVLTPKDSRKEFQRRGWKSVVGFQTRNPIHRAHEYLLKCALEISDGLFIHPLVGYTKKDDIPSSVRLQCYKVLIEKYFPKERVVLSPFPAAMRYAGPREAVFHALVRKNYGCTHFIVGRDHAGVGNFYGPFEAQEIFSQFNREEIGINPLFFDHAFYCLRCEGMATSKTCPHTESERVILSGSRVRKILRKGERLPSKFTRAEVAEILLSWAGEKVEA
jgi:sulfate adenylyltransferase